jgi:phosphoglycerate kinase
LGQILEKASFDSCEVILVGGAACKALKREKNSSSRYIEFQNATVVWEFLKGRILPGIAALDKVSHALQQLFCWIIILLIQ